MCISTTHNNDNNNNNKANNNNNTTNNVRPDRGVAPGAHADPALPQTLSREPKHSWPQSGLEVRFSYQ